MSRDPSSLSSSTSEEKKVRDNDKPLGSLSSSTSEQKTRKNDDNPGGLSLSPATQEKPTSRFFSWVAEDND